MSEELFLQLGEAQGFTELPMMFADALQQKTGGGLKGAAAGKFLKEQMKLGNVKTGDILPLVTQMMSAKAAPTLAMSSKSSMAEQARYQNAVNNQVTNANKSGVESGYARLFKAFTVAMEESTPVVAGLAKAFDEISKYVSFAIMLPQSIARAFDGRDSWVADAMGAANVKIAKNLYEGLASLGGEIKTTLGLAFDGWGLIIDEFGAPVMAFLQKIGDIFLYTFKMLNLMINKDFTGAANAGRAMTASLNGARPDEVKEIARTGFSKSYDDYKNGPASTTPRVDNSSLPMTIQLQMIEAARLSMQDGRTNSFLANQEVGDTARANSLGVMAAPAFIPQGPTVKHSMELTIKAEDIEGGPSDTFAAKIANVVKEQLGNVFTQTQTNFNLKESH